MLVVTVDTPEHQEVERRMAAELEETRATFHDRYGKYLKKEAVDA